VLLRAIRLFPPLTGLGRAHYPTTFGRVVCSDTTYALQRSTNALRVLAECPSAA
jgi:hypothetical protein